MKRASNPDYTRKPRNIDELIHRWAHGYDGHVGNVSCRDGKLYSYAACIARIEGDVVIHSTQRWSNTTTQHQSMAQSATNHMHGVYIFDPEMSVAQNMDWTRHKIAKLLESIPKPVMTKAGHEAVNSVKTREKIQAFALSWANRANAHAEALKHKERIATDKLDSVVKHIQRAMRAETKRQENLRKEREKRYEEERKERQEKAKIALDVWREHRLLHVHSTYLRDLPPALRLSKDRTEIETSHGATIPMDHVPLLWRIIKSVKAKGVDCSVVEATATGQFYLGHFQLNKIRADGSIVVGCHDIAFSEIEGIAKELGYV